MTQNYQAKKKANQRKKVRNCKVEKKTILQRQKPNARENHSKNQYKQSPTQTNYS